MIKRLIFVGFMAGWLVASGPAFSRDVTDPYEKYRSDLEKDEYNYDDSGDVPWKESGVEIPPLPEDDQLQEISLDSRRHLKIYLDTRSISVGENDYVTRYWLVIKAPGGGYNAMYEGFRCDLGEYKTYAHGYPNHKPQVRPVKKPSWREVRSVDSNDFRAELGKYYLCNGIRPRTLTEINTAVAAGPGQHKTQPDFLDF